MRFFYIAKGNIFPEKLLRKNFAVKILFYELDFANCAYKIVVMFLCIVLSFENVFRRIFEQSFLSAGRFFDDIKKGF